MSTLRATFHASTMHWSGAGRGLRTSVLLASVGCLASLALLPPTAQPEQVTGSLPAAFVLVGRSANPRSAVSTFCAHIPATTVSSIIGATVSLFEAVVKNNSLECIYFGKTAATAAHPIDEVVFSKQSSIPASQLATRAKAEARIAAESPKGVKLIFTSLPSIGPTAFSWTYAQSLNGGQLVGVANNKGTTGYGVALGGAAKTFGTAAKHVPAGERLLALEIAA
jgi:hypothetical protein